MNEINEISTTACDTPDLPGGPKPRIPTELLAHEGVGHACELELARDGEQLRFVGDGKDNAFGLGGSSDETDSPAAGTICAAMNPSGRSARMTP